MLGLCSEPLITRSTGDLYLRASYPVIINQRRSYRLTYSQSCCRARALYKFFPPRELYSMCSEQPFCQISNFTIGLFFLKNDRPWLAEYAYQFSSRLDENSKRYLSIFVRGFWCAVFIPKHFRPSFLVCRFYT